MDDHHNTELIKMEFSFKKASLIAVLFLVGYFGGIFLLLNKPEYCTIFSYVMISILYILVSFSLLCATKHVKKYGERTQIAWGFLTLSVLFSAVGSIVWAVIVLYFNQNPYTSIADFFYLLFFPLFLIGILIFPSSRVTSRQRFKSYFDIGMVIFAIVLVAWVFFIAPAIELYQGDMLSLTYRLVYILSGFILLFALLDLIFNRIKRGFQAPFLILVSSILILVATDSIYAYQNLTGTYIAGSIIDYGWLFGYILIGLAGVSQFTDQQIDLRHFLSKHIPWHADYHWTPYLALAGVFAAYICLVYAFNTSNSNIITLEVGVGVLIILVISRQIISIIENKNLYLKAQEEIEISKDLFKSLEKSESAYRTIFENTGTATLIFNENNIISMVNSKFEELSGYSKEEILGRRSWTEFIMDEDIHKALQYFESISETDESINNDFCFIDKSGNLKHVLLIFTMIPKSKKTLATILDVSDRIIAENELKSSLEEKEMLLKEIHHRVKNNLMVISSLLSLQSMHIKDKEHLEMFKESQSRAKSMALIHERLYQSDDLKRIDFGDYIKKLAMDSFNTYVSNPGAITLNIDVEPVLLDINTAIPLGLILNELLSNSMKYAFPNDKKGKIDVSFFKEDDVYTLIVSDNGIGFPESIDFENTDSLGLQLINSLTGQISGKLTLDISNGTSFKISFKEEEYN